MTRCGVLLPTFDPLGTGEPPPVVAAARRAEALGFDGVWAGDHLACPAPGLDAPSCLAAAAAVTARVTLGLSVMLLALRPPAWAAKQLQTIEALAGGRLRVGVGLGGEFPQEFAAAGVPVHERGRRVDETLEVLADLLGGRPVRRAGGALGDLDVPALRPAVAAMPPIYVGGRGEAALRRAARFGDAWLPMWLTADEVARRAERLAALAQEHGRPRPRLALLVGVRVDDDVAAARDAAAAHLRGLYGLDLEAVERWTALGGVAQVAEHLAAYVEAGVGELILMPLGAAPLAQYERLAEVRVHLGLGRPTVSADQEGARA
ncbi:LLM class flavin-dependent oxidoreductase [Capillimicrobium parvum]|uniref:Alkanesulfonate monooxygenase n=1 Tax=Capillimicrobium parvum TaxID=2884022 RepID=A0A9E6Y0U1_9ACTN|nr:LLM class flavin-dependent oxidoreductase [Capillimicrobium parvum]UGS38060.1 Alkanesulfonate monooxygenase [Capillimicrobium parvum]